MAKVKKLLTLEQLVQFCQNNKFYRFNSKDTGYTLSVQVPGTLTFQEKQSNTLLYTDVKVCHTLLNRNGSFISEENMIKAMPTLKNQPLLASIVEVDGDGTLDFNGHDMNIVENEDGTTSVEYIERQIGSFDATQEPYLQYDKEQDKTYVMATAAIPREYSEAASIIERKNGTKVSCELIINTMSYNASEKYLELEDFEFSGVCCLGEHVGEGMLGSRLDIKDFSTENNSVKFEQNDKLIETLEKLNTTLSNFNINNSKEGGNQSQMNKFEELLEQYGKTVEDIDFEYETMSDEELETKFAELFGEEDEDDSTAEGDQSEETNESEEDTDGEPSEEESTVATETEACGGGSGSTKKKKHELEEEFVKSFSISHEDIRCALYGLLSSYESSDNEYYWIESVYDDHFVYTNWLGNKIYGQNYTKDGDNVSFEGERFELYRELLLASEKAELDAMRSNYSSISEKLAKYESEPDKMKILQSSDYAKISDSEEFKKFMEQEAHFDLTVEEVKAKADDMLLAFAKNPDTTLSFSTEESVGVKFNKLPNSKTTLKKSRYGGLGKKKED